MMHLFQLCDCDGAIIGLCDVSRRVSDVRGLLSEAEAGVYAFTCTCVLHGNVFMLSVS